MVPVVPVTVSASITIVSAVILVLVTAVSVVLDVRADSPKVFRPNATGKIQYGMNFALALSRCALPPTLYALVYGSNQASPCYRYRYYFYRAMECETRLDLRFNLMRR